MRLPKIVPFSDSGRAATISVFRAGGATLGQRRVKLLLGLAALSCLGLLASAASAKRAAKPILRIGVVSGPLSLDPAKNAGTFTTLESLTHTPLIRQKQDGSFGPGLATSWRYISEGRGPNKDFELTLRHNAYFSNGQRVDARAVETWLEYFSHGTSSFLSYMGPLKSVEAHGKWKVRIHLLTPNPQLPYVLSQYPEWGHVSAPACVAEPALLAMQGCGAGPYRLDTSRTVTGDHYTYVPNAKYYDKESIRFSEVDVKVVSSSSSMLSALESGQIDVAQGNVSTASAANAAGFAISEGGRGASGLFFADRDGVVSQPLKDVRVRQAMNYAIDRRAIATGLFGKDAKPTSEISSTDGFDPKYQNRYPYNPARAKSLLRAAGYPDGFTVKVLASTAVGGSANGPVLDQAIAKYLAAVGVRLEITDAATVGEFVASRASKKYPIVLISTSNTPMFSEYYFFFYPVGPPSGNPFGASDPTLSKLMFKGLKAKNATAYWHQMSRRITTQAYFLPVFFHGAYWYSSKNVRGVVLTDSRSLPDATEWRPK